MTKLQTAVVSWLKKNVAVKKTKFAHTHVVQYFSAGRALDALMKVVSYSIWPPLQSPDWTSGLTLVNGKVKGGVWAEVGVQGAGHRPDAGADAPQDVPQVRILRSVFFVQFFQGKENTCCWQEKEEGGHWWRGKLGSFGFWYRYTKIKVIWMFHLLGVLWKFHITIGIAFWLIQCLLKLLTFFCQNSSKLMKMTKTLMSIFSRGL